MGFVACRLMLPRPNQGTFKQATCVGFGADSGRFRIEIVRSGHSNFLGHRHGLTRRGRLLLAW